MENIFAYILTKTRHMKLKLVKSRQQGFFKYHGFEYEIDRNAIYTKKLLGLKTIFWSMYLEGVSKPLVFNEKTYTLSDSDVPIDEIALLIRRVMRGALDIILLVLVAFNIILTVAVAMQVFNMGG